MFEYKCTYYPLGEEIEQLNTTGFVNIFKVSKGVITFRNSKNYEEYQSGSFFVINDYEMPVCINKNASIKCISINNQVYQNFLINNDNETRNNYYDHINHYFKRIQKSANYKNQYSVFFDIIKLIYWLNQAG